MLALCCSVGFGGSFTVCREPGACDFSDLQKALDHAQPGDTLVLRAGDTFSSPTGFLIQPKTGDGWIHIQSSRLADLPEGHRVGPEQSARQLLPRIVVTGNAGTVLRFGPLRVTASVNTETDTLTATNHGYVNGDELITGASNASPYFCLGVNNPIDDGTNDCSADKVGTFNVRGRTALQNGAAVYLFAQQMPEPFHEDTPYYIINLEESPTFSKFQLAATPGGEAIQPTTIGVGFSYTAAVTPLRPGQKVYVVNSARNSFQVAATAGGQPIDLTAAGPGGSFAKGGTPVRNIAIEGVEITVSPGVFTYVLLQLGSEGSRSREHMPNNLLVDRSYIHGNPGEPGPNQCVQINSYDVTIQNSTINECKNNSADAQAILVVASYGNIKVENNRLEASGETFMSGGAYPGPGITPTGMVFRRNYFTKPLSWFAGVGARIVNGTTVQIRQPQRTETCGKAASNHLAGQCFIYDVDNNRHVFDSDMTLTDPQGDGAVLVMWNHGLKALHNLAALTCSGPIECIFSNQLSWPTTATRLQEIKVSSGAFTRTTNYVPLIKNAFEVKHGKEILVEGNIFEHAWLAAQNSLFVLNVQAASNAREPLTFWSETSDVVIRNNILRKANTALTISGQSWLANRYEAKGLGFSGRHILRNNLLLDFDARNWASLSSGGTVGNLMALTSSADIRIDHNTVIDSDVRLALLSGVNRSLSITNNIVIPREGIAFSAINGTGTPSWSQAMAKNQIPEGTMSRNILLNRTGTMSRAQPGTDYPEDTFLLKGSNSLSAIGFLDLVAGDYRLSEDSPFSARCHNNCSSRGTDERDIGADLDEIFALTNGVEEGLPEWARRAQLTVEAGPDRATLSWRASSGKPCEVRVYEGNTYAQLIADVDPGAGLGRNFDTRATFQDGLRHFLIGQVAPLSSEKKYFYKLFCDGDIAVGSFQTPKSRSERKR